MLKITLAHLTKKWYPTLEIEKRKERMMFENFKGFDVDDMIFGTTEQIVSER